MEEKKKTPCILDGKDLSEVDVKDPNLSNEDLIRLYRSGVVAAKNELCERNLGLIRFVINKYGYHNIATSLSDEDLMQEGCFGLLKAVDMYDEDIGKEKNCLFSTYALFWIRQVLLRSIDNCDGLIRVPVHMRSKYSKARRIIAQQEMDKYNDSDKMDKASILSKVGITQKDFDTIDSLYGIASLNSPVCTEDGDTGIELGDMLPSNVEPLEDSVLKSFEYGDIIALFDSANLDARERFVLIHRYGLGLDQCPMTLQMIADMVGVTRERIRQIQYRAEKKIRYCKAGKMYVTSKTPKYRMYA